MRKSITALAALVIASLISSTAPAGEVTIPYGAAQFSVQNNGTQVEFCPQGVNYCITYGRINSPNLPGTIGQNHGDVSSICPPDPTDPDFRKGLIKPLRKAMGDTGTVFIKFDSCNNNATRFHIGYLWVTFTDQRQGDDDGTEFSPNAEAPVVEISRRLK